MNLPSDDDADMTDIKEGDDEYDDMRQSSAGALVRMSKRVGGWAKDQKSYNYIDTLSTGTLPAQWSTPVLLNGLVPGTAASQRVGREIRMHTLHVRFYSATTNVTTRFVLVYDHQPNGATPAVTDIFESNTWTSELNYSVS